MLKKIIVLGIALGLTGCAEGPNKNASNSIYSEQENNLELDLVKAAQLNVNLGLAYLKQGQRTRAKTKLNRAMKLGPQLSEVHYGMAFYLEQVGETDAARKAYQKSLALNPKGGIEHNNYGTFLCRNKEYRAAEKEFLIALQDPEYVNAAEALENAGLCVLDIPDEPKAIRYFERALRQDGNRPNALIEMAYISYSKQNLEMAKHYYFQYSQIADPTARSLWLGIKLAQRTGDKNMVSSNMMLLKNRFPNSKEYKEILDQI